MVQTEDLAQLRQLNLELLRQLWVGQDAVRRSVAKASSESSLDSSSSYNPEMPLSQGTSSVAPRASSPRGAHQGDPCDMSSPGGASSGVISLSPAKRQYQGSLSPLRPCSVPSLANSNANDPEHSAELEAQAPRFIPDQQRKLSKPRVTFDRESPMPERSWRLRPYLGYDWIAGSLDSSSPVSSKPEAFFAKLQEFREANKEECIHSDPGPQFLGLRESSVAEEEHEYPGTPCRLCRIPRDQRGPGTLVEPAQVRVSVPLSVLDPPHRYRIHRRKSFDASDTLALPRHCLLGWDILPPKSEKSSAPKSLDLWSYVTSEAPPQKLPAASSSHLALLSRGQPPTPIWSEPQVVQPRAPRLKP